MKFLYIIDITLSSIIAHPVIYKYKIIKCLYTIDITRQSIICVLCIHIVIIKSLNFYILLILRVQV